VPGLPSEPRSREKQPRPEPAPVCPAALLPRPGNPHTYPDRRSGAYPTRRSNRMRRAGRRCLPGQPAEQGPGGNRRLQPCGLRILTSMAAHLSKAAKPKLSRAPLGGFSVYSCKHCLMPCCTADGSLRSSGASRVTTRNLSFFTRARAVVSALGGHDQRLLGWPGQIGHSILVPVDYHRLHVPVLFFVCKSVIWAG
jgi:hypothetical protein